MHPMPRLAALMLPLLATSALADETVTFDDGPLGWSISGRTDVVVDGGNPGANMHCLVDDVFGIEVRTTTDQAFLGDLTRYGRFTLSIDVKINSILIGGGGQQVPRRFAIDLRDYNTAGPYPWTSVWYELGIITTARPGWVRYAVTIDDPNATALPPGWSGSGSEDATGMPRLPRDRTFASVLRSVDQIAFSTLLPGYFFPSTNFDIQVDNIHVGAPLEGECPGCIADHNGDGGVDGADVEAFFLDWQDSVACADANRDGGVDGGDVEAFFLTWQTGGC